MQSEGGFLCEEILHKINTENNFQLPDGGLKLTIQDNPRESQGIRKRCANHVFIGRQHLLKHNQTL